MDPMYQTEWHGIKFSDFTRTSSKAFAGSGFYNEFYKEFFKRYQRWDQLSPEWRKSKELVARFISGRTPNKGKVLSVGCGLGFIERIVGSFHPNMNLFIHEVSNSAWQWIQNDFPDDSKFIGLIPDCLPRDLQFDMVYLATVDFAFDTEKLIECLAAIRPYLAHASGQCLIVSASFMDTPRTLADAVFYYSRKIKWSVERILDLLHVRPRGQFWGWVRSREEFNSILKRAGYVSIEDGFINPEKRAHYWIAGRRGDLEPAR